MTDYISKEPVSIPAVQTIGLTRHFGPVTASCCDRVVLRAIENVCCENEATECLRCDSGHGAVRLAVIA
jgi:hypothetical protein